MERLLRNATSPRGSYRSHRACIFALQPGAEAAARFHRPPVSPSRVAMDLVRRSCAAPPARYHHSHLRRSAGLQWIALRHAVLLAMPDPCRHRCVHAAGRPPTAYVSGKRLADFRGHLCWLNACGENEGSKAGCCSDLLPLTTYLPTQGRNTGGREGASPAGGNLRLSLRAGISSCESAAKATCCGRQARRMPCWLSSNLATAHSGALHGKGRATERNAAQERRSSAWAQRRPSRTWASSPREARGRERSAAPTTQPARPRRCRARAPRRAQKS